MHNGHRTLIKFLLPELHTFDLFRELALVTQLDSDQEVTGSIPAGSSNILLRRVIMKCSQSLPSSDSRSAVVSFWQKNGLTGP